jgi:hypothetical protein
MPTFVAIAISNPAAVASAVSEIYPGNHMKIREEVWLVRDNGTSKDVSDKLKITTEAPAVGPSGSAVVFAIAGYFGAASPSIWEFIQNKG